MIKFLNIILNVGPKYNVGRIKLRHTALVTAYGNTAKNIKSYVFVTTYRCHNPGLRHGNMFAPLTPGNPIDIFKKK